MPLPTRILVLVAGCLVLGVGVAMLLTADLGSDGYSSLVNGLKRSSGIDFAILNVAVGVVFLAVAALRGLLPGVGTLCQVVVVGVMASWLLRVFSTPGTLLGQVLLLAASIPVLAIGIAGYLGSRLGAGPVEAAALAWDPPVPFRWSYIVVQGGGALVGWALGATLGLGTLVAVLLLGPAVDLASRVLRLDVHQGGSPSPETMER